MRIILIWASFLIMIANNVMAQNESNFEVLPPTKPDEVIFEGTCTFIDLEEVPAFNFPKSTKDYMVDKKVITTLSTLNQDYQLKVFLGTWCEDSHRLIPQLSKVLNELKFPIESLQLYALNRDKKSKSEAEQPFKIQFVPTIVVIKNGEEAGRIVETVQKSVEADLLNILQPK